MIKIDIPDRTDLGIACAKQMQNRGVGAEMACASHDRVALCGLLRYATPMYIPTDGACPLTPTKPTPNW